MTKPRILVVEDERIVNLDIQGALSRLGYAPAGSAGSGEEAVEAALALRPDLVLMDIHLAGGMDGTEAAARIGRDCDIPVVFLTAYSDEETMARALSTAPFGYLLKPFEDRELRGVIELALAKSCMERDLRRAGRAAEEASQAKSAFLATVSHELRTPINGILGMAELLLLSGLGGEQRELAEQIKRSALDFGEVLTRLLDFSQLDEDAVRDRAEAFDLRALLEQAARPHRVEAGRLGLDFSLKLGPVPVRLRGNRGALSAVLDQLVGNALRNTPSGGVTLEAGPDPLPVDAGLGPETVSVLFTVRDTGKGMTPEELSRFFAPFTQSEPYLTRRCGGLGLGLAMCERQVALLGGRIWAESSPGAGSAFHFALPFVRLGAPQAADEAQGAHAADCARDAGEDVLRGAHILVVEDDLVNRLVLTRALERCGVRAVGAEDGRLAVDALRAGDVDALVLDLQLPYLDGVSIAKMIRAGQTGARADTPIVALTADATAGSRQRCLQAGMNHALSKPADLERLKNLLRGELSARRPTERPC